MYISAIPPSVNRNNYSSNVKRVTSPSFQGGLSDGTTNLVLIMLKEKVTSVQTCSDPEELKLIIDKMAEKWANGPSNNSVGMMIIPENDLADFLGKEASKFDTKNNVGLCIAVGDKYGPVETWQKCYDAVTVLLPKSVLLMGA